MLFDVPSKSQKWREEEKLKKNLEAESQFLQLQSLRPQLLHPVLFPAEPCSDGRGGPSPHHQRMPTTCGSSSKAHYSFPKFPWAQSSSR